MEKVSKLRKVLRTTFTKQYNALQSHLNESNYVEAKAAYNLIEKCWLTLHGKDEEILSIMMDEDASEQDLEKEMTATMEYESKYELVKVQIMDLESTGNKAQDEDNRSVVSMNHLNNLNLPPIKIEQFDGNLKNWLPFWGQFEHIHLDESIPTFHKFRILLQSLKEGSRAKQVVDSFPISRGNDNYNAAIEALKERFGREDLLIEVYIRDLLGIVINNHKSVNFSLIDMYDKLECHLRFLEILGITTGKCAAILCPLLESCMSEEFLRTWQRSYISDEVKDAEQRLGKFREFIKSEVQNEQRVSLAISKFGLSSLPAAKEKSVRNPKEHGKATSKVPTGLGLLTTQVSKSSCIFCNQMHDSVNCFKARDMPLEEKLQCVRDSRCCYLCLKRSHVSKNCRVKSYCPMCDRKHAVIICPNFSRNKFSAGKPKVVKGKSEDADSAETPPANLTSTNTSLTCDSGVILPTIQLNLNGNNGRSCTIRAVFDTAAQRSYILNSTANIMNLNISGEETLYHSLFGGKQIDKTLHKKFEVPLSSLNGEHACVIEALGQDFICNDLPRVPKGPWIKEMMIAGIPISNVLNDSGPIDLLIGADYAASLFTGNIRKFTNLVGIETLFGWTISGKLPVESSKLHSNGMLVTSMLINNMNVADFWRLDLIGIDDPTVLASKDQSQTEINQYFLDTVVVNQEGRYEVNLPWKKDHTVLPNNYELANKRLASTHKKLNSDGCLEEYRKILNEWVVEGVIEDVTETNVIEEGHYMPHRHVVKLNSSTKVRPVFDASAHAQGSPSLNDCLEKGCNLIEQIPALLHMFRMKKVGVVADIRRAFLQISINPKDRRFLKFLWNENGKIIVFQHNRVVFGLTSSPYLLAAVIKYHLESVQTKFDRGKCTYSQDTIDHLKKCFYVDNVVISFDSQEEAQTFKNEATTVMAQGKFDLRAWEYTDPGCDPTTDTHVLGVLWNRHDDTLKISTDSFKIDTDRITKRSILSAAHRVFDPIGIVSPVTVCPKLLLKELWTLKLDWDDEVPDEIKVKFQRWINELIFLKEISIPRWLLGLENVLNISIHTFTDASEVSYAAVVFVRVESNSGVKVQLVQSKTRIAPVKRVTIPRLELLAATIGARLFNSIKDHFPPNCNVHFWTDSSTVIAWLRRNDHWATFVSNRVKEITQLTGVDQWHHVPGIMNPADLPSRGCLGKKLAESRWWEGPEWLYLPSETWPSSTVEYDEDLISKERKKGSYDNTCMVCTNKNSSADWYYRYFSQYEKLVRMFAWIRRFVHNCRSTTSGSFVNKSGYLSSEEIRDAEEHVLKLVQQDSFHGVKDLTITSLQPFEDFKGLIRLRTKVSNRPDSMDFRFPILLPKNHPVVTRLLRNIHEKECHVGVKGLMSIVRERFWVVGGRRVIKSIVSSCVSCKRYDSKRLVTPAVPLPVDRVREASAFEVVGIDLTGPVYLKEGKKAWICLYTCAVVRAVHLELVQSLSTEDFLMALRRFIARRGRPVRIYSDQGKNFIGTSNLFEKIDWDKVTEYCNINRISWRFNPPTAAWWGGWWERLIGMTKRLLRKVIKRSTLSYIEMETVLCDCESVLNSRPLTYITDSETEPTPITPSLFIQDIRESGMPELDVIETADLKKKWQHRAKLKEDFRKRFRSEYLGLLQEKGRKVKLNDVKEGDIVLIGSDNYKRLDWPLAKVVELFPGKDGKTRLVRLKTSTGECMRPVQKLYRLLEQDGPTENETPLPISDDKVKTSLRGRIIKKPLRYE